MIIDFDLLSNLDLNLDDVIDTKELKMFQFREGNGFTIEDLNNNGIFDRFENDLDQDGNIDDLQITLNSNVAINELEREMIGISFDHDINHSNAVDQMDLEIAKAVFNKK